MAIDIIPKTAAEANLGEKIFLYLSIVLLLASIIGYLVTDYYFLKKASAESQQLDEALSQAKTDESNNLEAELSRLKEGIDIFSLLIEKHKRNSNFFYLIEGVTHPQVFFSEISLDSNANNVRLSGETENFRILGEQLIIFKNTEFIGNLKLGEISTTEEGKISFQFNISINPRLFTQ